MMAGRTRQGALATGMLWVALPCGLLYSALKMASIGNGPLQGTMLRTLFTLGNGVSLLLGPRLWQRFRRAGGVHQAWGARLAGLLLAGVAAHAVGWISFTSSLPGADEPAGDPGEFQASRLRQ
ncbi:sulfite exporter TauE/SafE family protein [Variovorax sp. UMC13]|uniref:urease accessory protein UreH domain-containing protein n=1 Tax=Variovorax sp. UMC13 TaxID=1862326 RepID=UPI00387074A9